MPDPHPLPHCFPPSLHSAWSTISSPGLNFPIGVRLTPIARPLWEAWQEMIRGCYIPRGTLPDGRWESSSGIGSGEQPALRLPGQTPRSQGSSGVRGRQVEGAQPPQRLGSSVATHLLQAQGC